MTKAKLTTCQFVLSSEQMFGAKDAEGNYYVAVTEVDACFYPDFTRTKMRLNSLKAALGADVHPEKLRVGRSYRSFIKVETFAALILHMALEENSTMAKALLQATLAESIQRRMDNVLGVEKTEVDYEKAAAELYKRIRDEHKVQYKPFVTSWAKLDKPKGDWRYYAGRTNELKKAVGFADCVSVNDMTTQQLMQWNSAEVRYDSFRRAGLNHREAMAELAQVKEITQS